MRKSLKQIVTGFTSSFDITGSIYEEGRARRASILLDRKKRRKVSPFKRALRSIKEERGLSG
jgi:hypothetical protein